MTLEDEDLILRKAIPGYENLSAAELSSRIITRLKPHVRKAFMEANRKRMRYLTEAEESLRRGSAERALELLRFALARTHYGNEYPLGLMGDAYAKKGDVEKALEFYEKSGSYDSLKKARQMRFREGKHG